MEIEKMYKKKDKYILPHKPKIPKEYVSGTIEKVLSFIFHKVKEHNRVLKDLK